MGTWGTGILDNDLAADIKAEWNELLGEGYSAEEVSNHILAVAQENGQLNSLEDQYEIILPLALLQWKSGRLQEDVKEFALELLIDENINNIEKSLWENTGDLKKRLINVYKLRETINAPPPKPTKIKKAFYPSTNLKQGDLFTIKLTNGYYILLEVIKIDNEGQSQYPICVLFDYRSIRKPTINDANNASVLKYQTWSRKMEPNDIVTTSRKPGSITFLSSSQRFSEPLKRIEVLEENRVARDYQIGTTRVCFWKDIDEVLNDWLTK